MNAITTILLSSVLAAGAPPDAEDAKPAPGDAQKKPSSKKPSSLDEDLFGDLTGDLFDGLEQPKLKDKSKPGAAKKTGEQPDPLGSGEDIGQEGDPLLDLGRRMRKIESLIAGGETGQPTQRIQEEIVKDLDKLIELMRKKCAQCQGGQGSSSPKSGNKFAKGKGGTFKPNPRPTGSDEGIRDKEIKNPNPEAVLAMNKQVWGQLPQHVQEAIRNARSSKFLFEYSDEIKEYFARLAELYQQANE